MLPRGVEDSIIFERIAYLISNHIMIYLPIQNYIAY